MHERHVRSEGGAPVEAQLLPQVHGRNRAGDELATPRRLASRPDRGDLRHQRDPGIPAAKPRLRRCRQGGRAGRGGQLQPHRDGRKLGQSVRSQRSGGAQPDKAGIGMIDFYYWPTPYGWKVAIMLEECGLEYRVIPVNIGRGDQFKPEFLAISPNNRMPAIVDHGSAREFGDGPLPVFESGAILIHLAERTGRFMPQSKRGRKECLEWLFWQVGNLGPMAGQLSHFVNYAQGEHPYSHKRYADEYNRCLGVLERQLADRDYILDEYSIADIASWPWVLIAKPLGQPLDEFPNVARWREAVKQRPAVQSAVDLGKELRRSAPPSDAERRVLFNQTARDVLPDR